MPAVLLSALLTVTLVALLLLSLVKGVVSVPLAGVLPSLLVDAGNRAHAIILWDMRLPRFLVGALSGAALAASGVLLQGALRNDLADPGLLGVSSGASLVVAVIVVMGLPVSPEWLPLHALAGGLVAGLVILLATRTSRDPVRTILIGAALSALFSAGIVLVVVLGNAAQIQTIYAYLTGSLIGRDWGDVGRLLPWVVVGLPLAFTAIPTLNALRLGDEMAAGLGVHVFRARFLMLSLAIILVAPVVAVSGPIGFIALVAPHLARAALRSSDARAIFPTAVLLGAALLSGADLIAREMLKPAELPVGLIVTALGAPVAIVLLRRLGLQRPGSRA